MNMYDHVCTHTIFMQSPAPGLQSFNYVFLSFSHVCVALKVTEKLLAECEQRHLQLIADSYLDMLHVMLESSQSKMRIMATKSVS